MKVKKKPATMSPKNQDIKLDNEEDKEKELNNKDDSGESDDFDDLDDDDEDDDYDDGGGNMEDDNETESSHNDSGVDNRYSVKRKASNDGVKSEKKYKSENANLHRAPTVKELNQLRETENLFHSNLFRLQIEEMLKEIQVRDKYKPLFEKWLQEFKDMVDNIDETVEYDLTDLEWLKKLNVKYPLPELPPTTGVFKFMKPKSVTVIGSYASGCCLGPDVKVDVKLEIPKNCFHKKDYLNHQYHRKRALYLAYIARKLKDSELVQEINYLQSHGNPLLPVLEVKPAGDVGKHVLVVIHFMPSSHFKMSRFSLVRNNIRPNWFFEEADTVNKESLTATPHYNTSIVKEMMVDANEEFRNSILQDHPSLRDGILLLKVWLKQRGLDEGYGGFSGYIMSMYVLYLFQTHRINAVMSSYQVARITWSNIAQSDWTTEGISLARSVSLQTSDFHSHFDVVFVDASGTYNLCADMSKYMFFWVKRECELAVKCLDNPNINSFQALFMTKMPFYRQFDHILRLENGHAIHKIVSEHSNQAQKLDLLGHMFPQAQRFMLNLMQRGLQDRVLYTGVMLPPVKRWALTDPYCTQYEPITLGFVLNPEYAFSILDKGPGANLPEALQFRSFWGRKSEVRRFQDGSICETVVWHDSATLQQKRLLCRDIAMYLLEERVCIPMEPGVLYVAHQLDTLLESHLFQPDNFDYGTGEEASVRVIKALEDLIKQLRQIKDIPLEISTIQGTSPVFRYCEVYPPIATLVTSLKESREKCHQVSLEEESDKPPHWIPVIEAVIQLGLSGKWPQDLAAVRRIKAAFYIKIAQGLIKKHQLTVQPFPDRVCILKDGFVFSLVIAHQREISLLKETSTPTGITKYRDTPESLSLEKKVIHLPKLSSALHGLHQQHSAYGPTCCLAKRWLSAQLLDPFHFPEMCVELLVASLFLSPEPFHPPNQPQLGFFRFLKLVGNTNWQTEPMILNLNSEMDREEILEIENKFRSSRSSLPPLFLVTPYDRTDSIWTKKAPTLQILIRVAMLARESLRVIEGLLFSVQKDWKVIFRPPLDAYDVIIHLNPKLNPRQHEAVDPDAGMKKKKKKLLAYEQSKDEKIPVMGFDPVSYYLQELRDNFSDYALFFCDIYGGNKIAVLWKPPALTPKPLKVSNVNCHKPLPNGNITLNIDAIIEDFSLLGSGLVKSIEMKTSVQ